MIRSKIVTLILCALFAATPASLTFAQADDSTTAPAPQNAAVMASAVETNIAPHAGSSTAEFPAQVRAESSSSAPDQSPSDPAQFPPHCRILRSITLAPRDSRQE
jgi:hypothetical protein